MTASRHIIVLIAEHLQSWLLMLHMDKLQDAQSMRGGLTKKKILTAIHGPEKFTDVESIPTGV